MSQRTPTMRSHLPISRFARVLIGTAAAICALTLGAVPALAQDTGPSVAAKLGEWRYLNADPQASRYAPLDQINAANFKDLKIAWRWTPNVPPAPPKLGGTAQGNGDPT